VLLDRPPPHDARLDSPAPPPPPPPSERAYLTASKLRNRQFLSRALRTDLPPVVFFDHDRCVPKGLRETAPPLSVFLNETTSFLR
jgi:hypothetical protein